jgi:hypothetical protein
LHLFDRLYEVYRPSLLYAFALREPIQGLFVRSSCHITGENNPLSLFSTNMYNLLAYSLLSLTTISMSKVKSERAISPFGVLSAFTQVTVLTYLRLEYSSKKYSLSSNSSTTIHCPYYCSL